MLHVKVAVNEPWHQGAAHPIDDSGACTLPFLDPLLIANKDDMFSPDCNRSCCGMPSICGEDVSVGNDGISIGGHGRPPDIKVGWNIVA
jgi:hypothetical protein